MSVVGASCMASLRLMLVCLPTCSDEGTLLFTNSDGRSCSCPGLFGAAAGWQASCI